MSRTRRNFPENSWFRKPKTFNEIKQNRQIFADIRSDEIPYSIDKLNRMRRHIPDSWDDVTLSAFYETDFKAS